MKSLKYIIFGLIFSVMLLSCKEQKVDETNETIEESEYMVIEKQQFDAESMKLEKLQLHQFTESYKTTGKIISNNSSKAMVNPYISGKIKEINVTLNSIVKKGQVLFVVESEDYVELQKNYFVAQAQLKPAKANYLRQKELYKEKIASEKEFLQAEAEYKILLAEADASLAKLEMMNIPVSSIEDGNIKSHYAVYSPLSGQVQKLQVQIGEYVDPQTVLMSLVNDQDALLEFVIYADFASNIKMGQQLHFYTSVTKNKGYKAEVISVGRSMNTELQGVVCQAKILDDAHLIPGSKVMLEIFYNHTQLPALIHEAIIEKEDGNYVLVKHKEDENNYYFKKEKVETGLTDTKYIEIISPPIASEVLTHGAYYMNLD